MPQAASSDVPLAASAYERTFAGGVRLQLLNRFVEQDTSAQSEFSLVARPGTDYVATIGIGPTIRSTFTQDGVFNNDLFVVSGDGLYRYDGTSTILIAGAVGFATQFPSMAIQASPGIERLWLADGEDLFYYDGAARAQATLQLDSPGIAAGDTVQIGTVYYRWVASGVDAGAPAGTAANPWLVLLGGEDAGSLDNLSQAIGNTGVPGGAYSTSLTAHPLVQLRRLTDTSVIVEAITPGAAGDAIVVADTSAALSWDSSVGAPVANLVSGGAHFLVKVPLPEGSDDADALAVTALAGFIIVAAANMQRLFFIFPGEFWTDTFADAEAEPDQLVSIKTVGDLLWVLGTSTIEIWAATGDSESPFAPVSGRTLRFGTIPDTVAVLDGRIFYVDTSGIVRDGSGERLSTHPVEERIRLRG